MRMGRADSFAVFSARSVGLEEEVSYVTEGV
jgi:hypothetical protein